METVCRVCGGPLDKTIIDVGPWKIDECTRCGSGVLVPLPAPEVLDDAYHSGLYSKEKGRVIPVLEGLLNWFHKRRLDFAGARGATKSDGTTRRFLDIGAGKGRTMRVARRRGFDVVGIEPHNERNAFGVDAYGIRVFQGPLEAFPAEEEPFDVIVSWHVLEHVPFPADFLTKVRPLMADDGVFALEVPNMDNWAFTASRRSWYQLSAPYHLEHLTPQSLRMACEAAGFTIEYMSTFSVEHGPFTWMQSMVNRVTGQESLLYRMLKRNWSPKGARDWVLAAVTLAATGIALLLTPLWILLSLVEDRAEAGSIVRVRLRKGPEDSVDDEFITAAKAEYADTPTGIAGLADVRSVQ